MTTPTITLGMRLSIARRQARVQAKELAKRLRVADATISRYENDATPVPESVLYAYQAICDVPIEWLRGEMDLHQEVASFRWGDQRPLFELRPTG